MKELIADRKGLRLRVSAIVGYWPHLSPSCTNILVKGCDQAVVFEGTLDELDELFGSSLLALFPQDTDDSDADDSVDEGACGCGTGGAAGP